MKITIAYLYYDILNLYGESGNIKVLKKQFEDQGINVIIKFLSIDDDLDFSKYDVVYMGMGTEDNKKIALKHLYKYRNDIKQAINDNKFFIITGNSIDMFGKYLLDKNNKKIRTLHIFEYYCKEEEFRIVDEALMKCDYIKKPIIGFQNQESIMRDNDHPMFNVLKGTGSYPNSLKEGVLYKNFYGTYLIGPLLVRNPELTKYLVRKIILSKDNRFSFNRFNLMMEKNAYNTFMENYYKEYIKK